MIFNYCIKFNRWNLCYSRYVFAPYLFFELRWQRLYNVSDKLLLLLLHKHQRHLKIISLTQRHQQLANPFFTSLSSQHVQDARQQLVLNLGFLEVGFDLCGWYLLQPLE